MDSSPYGTMMGHLLLSHNQWSWFLAAVQQTFDSPSIFISSMKTSLKSGHFVKVFKEGYFLVGQILVMTTQLNNIVKKELWPWLDGEPENGLDGFA
jgi:hypothetical protein